MAGDGKGKGANAKGDGKGKGKGANAKGKGNGKGKCKGKGKGKCKCNKCNAKANAKENANATNIARSASNGMSSQVARRLARINTPSALVAARDLASTVNRVRVLPSPDRAVEYLEAQLAGDINRLGGLVIAHRLESALVAFGHGTTQEGIPHDLSRHNLQLLSYTTIGSCACFDGSACEPLLCVQAVACRARR